MEVKIKRDKGGNVCNNEVKLDSYDSWNADWTIAQIVAPLLGQLKEMKQGAPFVDDEDVPVELRSTSCAPKKNEWDIDDNHFKRWDWVLNEMIFTMQEIANDEENEPDMFKHVGDMVIEENPDGTSTMVSSGMKIISEMEEQNRQYHERLKNGCLLFGKYFRNLWS